MKHFFVCVCIWRGKVGGGWCVCVFSVDTVLKSVLMFCGAGCRFLVTVRLQTFLFNFSYLTKYSNEIKVYIPSPSPLPPRVCDGLLPAV